MVVEASTVKRALRIRIVIRCHFLILQASLRLGYFAIVFITIQEHRFDRICLIHGVALLVDLCSGQGSIIILVIATLLIKGKSRLLYYSSVYVILIYWRLDRLFLSERRYHSHVHRQLINTLSVCANFIS